MWTPFPGSQWRFCSTGTFEALYGGAAGPGKTDCLVALASRRIDHPRYKGLLLRRTFPQLREIMDRCWALYPGFGGTYRATEHRWKFPSGATIDLGHMQHEDDKHRYHGREFHFVGFDELTQFSEAQYLYIFSRLRSAHDESLKVQIRSTSNPGGLGHRWVKDRFIDIIPAGKTYVDSNTGLSRVFIPGRVHDNLALMENDPSYVKRLEALPRIERLRYLDGDWDTFEGQALGDLSQRIHGCEPFDVPPEWERFMVLDWGFAKPFSVGWYAVDYDGILYRYREWYGCKPETRDTGVGMVAADVARGILERERGEKIRVRIADPSIFHKSPAFRKKESQGPTIGEDFTMASVHFTRADNDRVQGLQQVHKRLQLDDDVDEETGEVMRSAPRLQVFNDCQAFWRTVPELQLDPKNPEDVDTKGEDHAFDEFRYACMHRPIKPKKVEQTPKGSFAHERNKLIRARRMARTRGISLEQAYRRL